MNRETSKCPTPSRIYLFPRSSKPHSTTRIYSTTKLNHQDEKVHNSRTHAVQHRHRRPDDDHSLPPVAAANLPAALKPSRSSFRSGATTNPPTKATTWTSTAPASSKSCRTASLGTPRSLHCSPLCAGSPHCGTSRRSGLRRLCAARSTRPRCPSASLPLPRKQPDREHSNTVRQGKNSVPSAQKNAQT